MRRMCLGRWGQIECHMSHCHCNHGPGEQARQSVCYRYAYEMGARHHGDTSECEKVALCRSFMREKKAVSSKENYIDEGLIKRCACHVSLMEW